MCDGRNDEIMDSWWDFGPSIEFIQARNMFCGVDDDQMEKKDWTVAMRDDLKGSQSLSGNHGADNEFL